MVRINPDPHAHGYQYEPTRAVTALLPAGTNTEAVVHDLADAGFGRERIDVFTG